MADPRFSGGTSEILPAERRRASFDSAVLQRIIAGQRAARIDKFKPLFDKPPFSDQHEDVFASYEEKFEKSMKRATEAFRIVRDNPSFFAAHAAGKLPMESMVEHNGIYVHFTMTMQFLKSQATKEQQKKWLKRAKEGTFIGAYCQTELGHGSNVRGLETTATFVPETQEFEIHSPTLTSLKWWPTGMYACTHALVFANLITDGKARGFHGFMVQLRQADGTPMPGIEIGEIGPKINTHNINIGYCRFSNVRIPREYMFSKYSSVTPTGEYQAAPPKLSKYRYISLMFSRTSIVALSYQAVAQAAVIGIRYSAVRQQGFKNSSDEAAGEHVILDYQMQQMRLFKALALSYSIIWNSRYIKDFLVRVQQAIDGGDDDAADDLPELHASLSGIKVVATVRGHEAIEECRKCCGGQGFLLSSGVARLSSDFSEWVTVEGEQVILALQVSRALVKAVGDVEGGRRVAASVAYLGETEEPRFERPGDVLQVPAALRLLAYRARRLVVRLAAKVRAAEAQGQSFDEALAGCAALAYRAAEAHAVFMMFTNNSLAMEAYFAEQPAIRKVLEKLLQLLIVSELVERGRDWAGVLGEEEFVACEERSAELLAELRPEAVALADAFGWSDKQLHYSTLGRYDGNVYEAIYEAAKENPLNKAEKMIGWDDLATQLDLDFLREEAKLQRVAAPSAKL